MNHGTEFPNLREHLAQARLASHCGGLSVVDVEFAELEALLDRFDRMQALLNTPHTAEFLKGVEFEMPHQRQRWSDEHDRAKTPEEWVFLFGYLAGKCVAAKKAGDVEKARHHAITAAAAMGNLHRLFSE